MDEPDEAGVRLGSKRIEKKVDPSATRGIARAQVELLRLLAKAIVAKLKKRNGHG